MSLTLIGQKIGMAQVFDKNGNRVVCTVIQAQPNTVLQIKKKYSNDPKECKDGYNSIQLGSIPSKHLTKPLKGKFEKVNVAPCRTIRESRLDEVDQYQVGEVVRATKLIDEKISAKPEKNFLGYIDVEATSKGKGYQGVMKLHGYSGMPASHGHSVAHRHAGGTGMRSTPGRCFKNGPRASRMGGYQVTVQNLKLIAVKEDGLGGELLLVQGAVPGAQNGVVFIRKSVKLG